MDTAWRGYAGARALLARPRAAHQHQHADDTLRCARLPGAAPRQAEQMEAHVAACARALAAQDGHALASLLLTRVLHGDPAAARAAPAAAGATRFAKAVSPAALCAPNALPGTAARVLALQPQLEDAWAEILVRHYRAVVALARPEPLPAPAVGALPSSSSSSSSSSLSGVGAAYAEKREMQSRFLTVFAADPSNWALPVLHVVNAELRVLAERADAALRRAGQKEERLEDCQRRLQEAFRIMATDRAPLAASKRWGALGVANNMLIAYFRLKKIRLCRNVIRSILSSKGFPTVDEFPLAQVVTYKYFMGRVAMFEGAVGEAEEQLADAFARCTVRSPRNQRLILLYLLAVRLSLGKFPPRGLLEACGGFPHFTDVIASIRQGNVRLFDEALERHQEFFIRRGVYLTLERAKLVVYRNLVRRCCRVLSELSAAPVTKVHLSTFECAFRSMRLETGTDEIECILANLIFNGFVRGYLSHQASALVLSRRDPFPAIGR